jgi:hypothetical protein
MIFYSGIKTGARLGLLRTSTLAVLYLQQQSIGLLAAVLLFWRPEYFSRPDGVFFLYTL